MTDLNKLKQELKTFQEKKNELLTEAKDKFALIKQNKVLGTFSTYEDALAEGYKRFGNTAFLVKQVSEVEEVNYFTRPTFTSLGCHS